LALYAVVLVNEWMSQSSIISKFPPGFFKIRKFQNVVIPFVLLFSAVQVLVCKTIQGRHFCWVVHILFQFVFFFALEDVRSISPAGLPSLFFSRWPRSSSTTTTAAM
jgi:hypothetical protein